MTTLFVALLSLAGPETGHGLQPFWMGVSALRCDSDVAASVVVEDVPRLSDRLPDRLPEPIACDLSALKDPRCAINAGSAMPAPGSYHLSLRNPVSPVTVVTRPFRLVSDTSLVWWLSGADRPEHRRRVERPPR